MVMFKVLRGYQNKADWDDLKSWGLQALWNALEYHNYDLQKFTSTLHRMVHWEVRKRLSGKKQILPLVGNHQDKKAEDRRVRAEQMAALGRYISCLTEYEKRLLRLRYYHDWSHAQIAEADGVTSESIRFRLNMVLDKLRSSAEADCS